MGEASQGFGQGRRRGIHQGIRKEAGMMTSIFANTNGNR
jgi:hypothetical protein